MLSVLYVYELVRLSIDLVLLLHVVRMYQHMYVIVKCCPL